VATPDPPQISANERQATTTISSPWFRGIDGTLVAFSTPDIIHAERIQRLKAEQTIINEQVQNLTAEIDALEAQERGNSTVLKQYSTYIKSIQKGTQILHNKRIPLDEAWEMTGFYQKNEKLPVEDIFTAFLILKELDPPKK